MKHGDPNIPVQVYGDDWCGWTRRAVHVLQQLGIEHEYIDLRAPGAPTTKDELKRDTGWRTQPWIFVEGEFIGGCTDLLELLRNAAHSGEE